MATEKLSSEQQKKLQVTLQGALEQSATTLGMMLGGSVKIREATPVLRSAGVSVWLGLNGALEGELYLELPENMAIKIVKRLTAVAEPTLLDEASRSALMELGNVLASVFVGYFDQSRGLRTLPTPPELSLVSRDMPDYAGFFTTELSWSYCQDKAELRIGLQQPALDILLN